MVKRRYLDEADANVRVDQREGLRRRGWPISVVLVCGIALPVVLAAVLIYVAGYEVARRNTSELARDKSEILIHSIERRVHSHLEPVRTQLEYISEIMEEEALDLRRRTRLGELLAASLAASPQVSVVAFANPEQLTLRAFRYRPEQRIKLSDWGGDPGLGRAIARARARRETFWGELFVAEDIGLTFMNLFRPVYHGERFVGVLIAGVSIHALSEFLGTLEGKHTDNAFILYDRDFVLAHPRFLDSPPAVSDAGPLPGLSEFGDPVLARIWTPDRFEAIEASFVNDAGANDAGANDVGANSVGARVVEVDGAKHVFLFRQARGYGERPWTIGVYLELEEIVPQLGRLRYIAQIGLVVLAMALALGLLLGRALGRPIRRLASAAMRVRHLDFERLPRIRHTVFRELNEAAEAYNAMLEALRSFASYVPGPLVRRLIQQEREVAIASEEREITILFTDVVGFTALAETLPAAQVADFLNHHFALVETCVEAEQGTIDKYIGDAVMAFWGAPGRQPDHAARACRAAIGIAQAIRRDNVRRRERRLPPLRLRLGVHTGWVVVGNIGGPGRINYTVVGDAVNTAQRLEVLARDLGDGTDEVFTLISGATAARLGKDFSLASLGRHHLRGRHGGMEVFALEAGAGRRVPRRAETGLS